MLKTKYCERKKQQSNDSIKLNLVWDDIHINNMKKYTSKHFQHLIWKQRKQKHNRYTNDMYMNAQLWDWYRHFNKNRGGVKLV